MKCLLTERLSTNKLQRVSSLHLIRSINFEDVRVTHSKNNDFQKLQQTLTSLQQRIAKTKQLLTKGQKTHNNFSSQSLQKQKATSTNQLLINSNLSSSVSTSKQTKQSNYYQSLSPTFQNVPERKYEPSRKMLQQYYVGGVLKGEDNRFIDHIQLCYNIFSRIQQFKALNHTQINECKIIVPLLERNYGKKTLLLDIDDTILVCDDEKSQNVEYDMELFIQNDEHNSNGFMVYVKLRPFALSFLKNMSKKYEIIAYTGSSSHYAKKVISQIDPFSQIFSYSLFRQNCFEIGSGIYVKDIRIINRRPENIVLVDNSPYSFLYQLQNGVPIVPFDKSPDCQLLKLQKYLNILSQSNDIREMNKSHFKFHLFQNFPSVEAMMGPLYYLT